MSPQAVRPNIIGVSASNLVAGEKITFTNLTRGGTRISKLTDANGKVVLDLANDFDDYEIGDVVLIEAHGTQEGGKTYTIVDGGVNTSLVTAASSAASISL